MMRKTLFLLTLFVFFGGLFQTAQAQDVNAGLKPSVVLGDVASISDEKIVLQTKDGSMDVVLSAKTAYKRVPAENPNLAAATASNFSDIAVGDKLVVTGIVSGDKKSVPAKTVYLMTKADIAQRQTKEQEQWRTRGISGKVTAVNPQTKEITVSTPGLAGAAKITVLTAKDTADFRRYAPDSVQFSQAKPSAVNEIQVGDAIRALGDKGADGATFSAERIITGSFQTIGGTIKAIDTAKNEITITNVQTKKDMTIVVGGNSVLKQFPAEMAQRMSMVQSGGGMGMQPGGQGGMRPPQNGQNAQPNATGAQTTGQPGRMGGGMGMRGGAGSIDDMLDRFPNITIADLKVGEMIAASSSKSGNSDRVIAIKLLSGVEPFLRASQAAGGRQGGGQRGQDAGFTIPGLDGIGLP